MVFSVSADRARRDDNSATFVISESLGISGFEKGYSLFILTGVWRTILSQIVFYKRSGLFCVFFGLFLLSWEDMRGTCGMYKSK